MYNEIMTDLDNVFKTITRIPVSDIGVDLVYSAKEQLRAIYAKIAAEKEKDGQRDE